MQVSSSYEKPVQTTGLMQQLIMVFMAIVGVGAFVVAEQIITGWLPLGARANILRSDINIIEWSAIIFSIILGFAALRTAWGLFARERAGHSWALWLTLLTGILGFGITMSVIIPGIVKYFLLISEVGSANLSLDQIDYLNLGLYVLLGGIVLWLASGAKLWRFSTTVERSLRNLGLLLVTGSVVWILYNMLTFVDQFPTLVNNIRHPEFHRLIPGLFLMVFGFVGYLLAAPEQEVSDDLRRSVSMSPTKSIRVALSKSPSAGAIIGFIAIFFGFTMATDLFLEPTSVASILTNVSTKGVIAIGITILMISGEFDLSVGSILGVVAMTFMTFMTEGVPGLDTGPLSVELSAALSLVIAIILGLINGLILVRTGIPSFIVTLGTLLAYRAITLVVIAGGRILRYRDYFDEFPVLNIEYIVMVLLGVLALAALAFVAYYTLPGLWRKFSAARAEQHDNGHFGTTYALYRLGLAALITGIVVLTGVWLVAMITFHLENAQTVNVGWFDLFNGRWEFTLSDVSRGLVSIEIPRDANFRMAIVWWLIFVAFFQIILTRTPYGNSVFAVGGNIGAARAQGINVNRVKVQNFVLCAFLTGIAAIYETARNPGVDPLKGQGWELEVIAMTVIGGALLSGGYGSIIGSFLGALIFGMLQTGLVLVGIDSRLFQGTVGVIIIVAVVLNTTVRGKQKT